MKLYLSLILCLFLSCKEKKQNKPKENLSKKEFVAILKDLHLEEASFELQKNKTLNNTKVKLKNYYGLIYKQHHTSEEIFKKTLSFYANSPEKLETIYSAVLEQLTNEQSKFDQQ